MYLLLGNSHLESGDYKGAIQSFQRGVAQVQHYRGGSLLVISLVSFLTGVLPETAHCTRQITGWKFDNLGITIRQRMCEALYSAGRTKEAGESLLELVNTFGKEVYMNAAVVDWVSGEFTLYCPHTKHSIPSVRFHAALSLLSRKRR